MKHRLQIVIDAVRECAEAGMTSREAAESIGLSYNTIRSFANDFNIEFVNPNAANRDRQQAIIERFDAGETLESIGDSYGITRERVRQIVAKAGCKPRHALKREFRDQIIQTMQREWLTCGELASRFGVSAAVILKTAWEAGVKLPRRTREQEEELAALADRVRAGESFNGIAGGDHTVANRIKTYCDSIGVKSIARSRWADTSHRPAIILQGIADDLTWDQIAQKLSAVEGVRIHGYCLSNWAQKHVDLPKRERKPRPPKPVRAPKLRAERVYAPYPHPDVIVRDTVKDTALANRGRAPASAIAAAIGVTRNSIIGHWNRARAAGVIA